MWHPLCTFEDDKFDCTAVVMANGVKHINVAHTCAICCAHEGVKVACSTENCKAWGDDRKHPYRFHLTCARQAGLEVSDCEHNQTINFKKSCFNHVGSEHVLRAKLEDFIELERIRGGIDLKKICKPMTLNHAAKLLNWSVYILQCLGWAWRWAEWWVQNGDNWEPLIEAGQNEHEMTDEELRIVKSTKESRCADARRCRLSAFGAALRNRDYDKEPGDDRVALDRALRAFLHIPSLVGPLKQYEIDFFAEWLARGYRSKHKLLGFGKDKITVANYGRCLHLDDKSPKYELGSRPLPGKQELKPGQYFETGIQEVDDFLKPETFEGDDYKSFIKTKKERKRKKSSSPPNEWTEETIATIRSTSNIGTRRRPVEQEAIFSSADEEPVDQTTTPPPVKVKDKSVKIKVNMSTKNISSVLSSSPSDFDNEDASDSQDLDSSDDFVNPKKGKKRRKNRRYS